MSSNNDNDANSSEKHSKIFQKNKNLEKVKSDFETLLENINPFKPQDSSSTETKERLRLFKPREDREKNFEKRWEEFSSNSQQSLELWQEEQMAVREARLNRQVKNQRIRQKRMNQLQEQRQKERAKLKAFLAEQKEEFRQKLQELEGDRQTRIQEKRGVRRLFNQETQLREQTVAEQRRVARQNLQNQRKALRLKRQSARIARRNLKQGIRQEYVEETKELRQESWQSYIEKQRKETQKFFKSQNRIWWRGYLSLLAWVLGIFLLGIGVIYVFKLVGINLIKSITAGELIYI